MVFVLTLFSLSFIAMFVMIYLKSYEMRSGRSFFFHTARAKSDTLIKATAVPIRTHFRALNMHNFKALLHVFFVSISEAVHHGKKKLAETKNKISDILKRRGVMRRSGSVSFFLKNISDYKNKLSE